MTMKNKMLVGQPKNGDSLGKVDIFVLVKTSHHCNDPPRYDDKPHITSENFYFFAFKSVCACVQGKQTHSTLRRHPTTNKAQTTMNTTR